jgi:hypothetical protein
LNLSGNKFGNKGILTIFKGLAAAKSIVKVQLCDCGWQAGWNKPEEECEPSKEEIIEAKLDK